MSWWKGDDRSHSNAKLLAADLDGTGLYFRAVSWCSQHRVTQLSMEDLESLAPGRHVRRLVAVLVALELLYPADGFFCVDQHMARIGIRKGKVRGSLRSLIFERDNYTCQYCGATDGLSIDHIFPESLGGTSVPTNLQTLCRPCNSRKGARI